MPKCGLLIPNPLCINVVAIHYLCVGLCYFLLIFGRLAGQPAISYYERKLSIWLHFFVNVDVA